MKKEIISTTNAPSAIGPYSQAIKKGNFVLTSGQIPYNPETNELAGEDIETQARQALENVTAVLEAAGATLEDVVKTGIFVKNIEDFDRVNEVYATFFNENPPARSTVEVARLPKDVLIEIDAIAVVAE